MKKGFTLIELLIVVAIIAILAAIAVPNFLEAQTRAKVSRTKADMRSLVTAVETYKIDTNSYPTCTGNGYLDIWRPYAGGKKAADPKALYTIGFELTTPIAYITTINGLIDPFRKSRIQYYESNPTLSGRQYYGYINNDMISKQSPDNQALKDKIGIHGAYVLASGGPDGYINNSYNGKEDYKEYAVFPFGRNYDASNGTVSVGDIYRSPNYPDGGWERKDNL